MTEDQMIILACESFENGIASNCTVHRENVMTFFEIVKSLGPTIAIFSGLIGILITYKLELIDERRNSLNQSKRLASALVGEISAVREHIADFRYIAFFRMIRRMFKKGEDIIVPPRNSSGSFFITYSEDISDIGLLPAPLPEKVSNIYTKFVGIQEELRTVIMPEWNEHKIENKLPTVNHLIRELKAVREDSISAVEDLKAFIAESDDI
jgi:hypothetical protein